MMKNKDKLCPFCESIVSINNDGMVGCSGEKNKRCGAYLCYFNRDAWNNRPIEDALRKEIEEYRDTYEEQILRYYGFKI